MSTEPDLVEVPLFVQPKRLKPEHYKVICISTYTSDLAKLDATVAELKRRGFTKASRSGVLRAAMEQLNLDRIKAGSLR